MSYWPPKFGTTHVYKMGEKNLLFFCCLQAALNLRGEIQAILSLKRVAAAVRV